MKLYHGSNTQIDNVDLTMGRRGKDFGHGFYLSADYNQAAEFAVTVVRREGEGEPSISSFEFDEKALNILNVKIFNGYSKEWAQFILSNRQNSKDTQLHKFDIVIGPIADDSVGTQIRQLMRGFITLDTFIDNIKYKNTTTQYFFATKDALKYLKKL